MLQNPYLPAPSKASAWADGFTKGFVAISSPQPSDNVSPDDFDAFNDGVQAGSDCAANGIALDNPCVPALEGGSSEVTPGVVVGGADVLHGLWEALYVGKMAAGVAGTLVGLIELACELPMHTLPPEQVLPSLGQPLVDRLSAMGVDSMQLFCGAGLDPTATNCEIRISPVFKSQDQARQAAVDMKRPDWAVVSWRTDQCASFQIVDTN